MPFRCTRVGVCAVFCLFSGVGARQARAADPSDESPLRASGDEDGPWSNRRIVLAVHGGLGSAVGYLGGTIAYSPIPLLETEVGLGEGFYGTYLSVMQKITVGGGPRTHFVSGVGLAFAVDKVSVRDSPDWWLNLDLAGLETRFSQHFVLLLAGGLTVASKDVYMFYSSDCSERADCVNPHERVFPQIRLGLGTWF